MNSSKFLFICFLVILIICSVVFFCFLLWLKLYKVLYNDEEHNLPTHIVIHRPSRSNQRYVKNISTNDNFCGKLAHFSRSISTQLKIQHSLRKPCAVSKSSKRKHHNNKRSLPTILETTISMDEEEIEGSTTSSSSNNSNDLAVADCENQNVVFSNKKSEKRRIIREHF